MESISRDEFYNKLKTSDCVILRNFENLNNELLGKIHPDIDILCSSSKQLSQTIKTETRGNNNDIVHRKIIIDNRTVDLDIREIGDGYYDKKWEQDMIMTRVLYKDSFYVLNDEMYFYSLLYHAYIQKRKVVKDYIERLAYLSSKIEVAYDDEYAIQELERFMRIKGYKYTYPKSIGTIFNTACISKDLIEKNYIKCLERKIYSLIKL